MIIIADCGATKCDWRVLPGPEDAPMAFATQGFSPYSYNKEGILALLENSFDGTQMAKFAPSATEVFFYGTGLANPVNREALGWALRHRFPQASIELFTDLLGAARGCCGHEEGIACILGTGANSCYYDGTAIVKNSPSLGYILGDEGGGAYIGKKVIQHYLYKTFDPSLCEKFDARFGLSKYQILEKTYAPGTGSGFLASFAVFLQENRGQFMVEKILQECINDFFDAHLNQYPEARRVPVSFVGGVAHTFKDVLRSLCKEYRIHLAGIVKGPMDGLLKYHIHTEA